MPNSARGWAVSIWANAALKGRSEFAGSDSGNSRRSDL